jgi:hypothetical protein
MVIIYHILPEMSTLFLKKEKKYHRSGKIERLLCKMPFI